MFLSLHFTFTAKGLSFYTPFSLTAATRIQYNQKSPKKILQSDTTEPWLRLHFIPKGWDRKQRKTLQKPTRLRENSCPKPTSFLRQPNLLAASSVWRHVEKSRFPQELSPPPHSVSLGIITAPESWRKSLVGCPGGRSCGYRIHYGVCAIGQSWLNRVVVNWKCAVLICKMGNRIFEMESLKI